MTVRSIVREERARPHPQPAGEAFNISACALSRGKVCLMQFVGRQESPSFVSVMSLAGAEALAQQLLAAVAVAQEVRGAA